MSLDLSWRLMSTVQQAYASSQVIQFMLLDFPLLSLAKSLDSRRGVGLVLLVQMSAELYLRRNRRLTGVSTISFEGKSLLIMGTPAANIWIAAWKLRAAALGDIPDCSLRSLSEYHVKRCEIKIPCRTHSNWIVREWLQIGYCNQYLGVASCTQRSTKDARLDSTPGSFMLSIHIRAHSIVPQIYLFQDAGESIYKCLQSMGYGRSLSESRYEQPSCVVDYNDSKVSIISGGGSILNFWHLPVPTPAFGKTKWANHASG